MSDQRHPRCTIDAALGRDTSCPGASCCFWDDAQGACVFHAIERELLGRPDLSSHLAELREALAVVSPGEARMRFAHVLNQGHT
jgi:hypothetical protein